MQVKEKVEMYGVQKLLPYENISLLTNISVDKLRCFNTYRDIFERIEEIDCTRLQRAKLKAVLAVLENSRKEEVSKYRIKNPWDIYTYYMDELRYKQQEIFKVVLLNTKNEIIDDIDASMGTLNSSLVHPREVFKEAIKRSSNKIIVIHNHPSGSIEPSEEDKKITNRLIKCGELIGIEVIDHIIIGDGLYFSFKENMII